MQPANSIKKQIFKNIFLLFSILMLVCCLFEAHGMADDHGKHKSLFGHHDRHHASFREDDNEGNETAGQIAAWLLLVANAPVAFSLLVKLTTKYAPMGGPFKEELKRFNSFQKKYLMILHYYINLAVLCIVTWHWVTSRCKSSALPELGVITMIIIISCGVLIKFKMCPRVLRKSIYKIHTQPVLFLSLAMVLIIGHLVVD